MGLKEFWDNTFGSSIQKKKWGGEFVYNMKVILARVRLKVSLKNMTKEADKLTALAKSPGRSEKKIEKALHNMTKDFQEFEGAGEWFGAAPIKSEWAGLHAVEGAVQALGALKQAKKFPIKQFPRVMTDLGNLKTILKRIEAVDKQLSQLHAQEQTAARNLITEIENIAK